MHATPPTRDSSCTLQETAACSQETNLRHRQPSRRDALGAAVSIAAICIPWGESGAAEVTNV